jgi:hypothetical protein
MAPFTIKGRVTAVTGDPEDMTGAQAKSVLALTKSDVGLGNVDNTSDANAPVSTAQQTALNLKADKTTSIATTAPLTGGGDLSANRTLDISTFTASVKGAVPPPTTATGKFLKDDGTWAIPAGGTGGTDEVWVNVSAPSDTNIELWLDPDDDPPAAPGWLRITAAAYAALSPPNPNVLYVVIG